MSILNISGCNGSVAVIRNGGNVLIVSAHQTINKVIERLYIEVRIIWRGTAPIKFKETVIISVGDGAESAELTIHVFFDSRVPSDIMIASELAKFRHVQFVEQFNVRACIQPYCQLIWLILEAFH